MGPLTNIGICKNMTSSICQASVSLVHTNTQETISSLGRSFSKVSLALVWTVGNTAGKEMLTYSQTRPLVPFLWYITVAHPRHLCEKPAKHSRRLTCSELPTLCIACPLTPSPIIHIYCMLHVLALNIRTYCMLYIMALNIRTYCMLHDLAFKNGT